MSEELSTIGFEYIQICDEIKAFNKSLKTKKEKQKNLKTKLLNIMAEKNIPELALSNGTIFLDKKDSKQTLNKQVMSSALKEHYNETEAEKIATIVFENQPKKIVNKIRIKS